MAEAADGRQSSAELASHERQLQTLEQLSRRFGESLAGALSGGATAGRTLSGTLDQVGASLASLLSRNVGSAVSTTLSGAMLDGVRSLTASLGVFGSGAVPFAQGGLVSGDAVVPFAAGGVVAAPTYFPLGGGLGLAGEAGPEAILPLARGADGRLGVRSAGEGAANVTVNIAATDLESFRRSEAQVSAALARAVARGRRAL